MWCPMVDVSSKYRCTTVSSSSSHGLALSLLPLVQSSPNRLSSLATRLPPSPASSSSFRHSLRVVRVPMMVWDASGRVTSKSLLRDPNVNTTNQRDNTTLRIA